MDTNAPAPKPDMLEHAGKLLKRLNGMSYVSDNLVADNENTVALASAVLAVATELRDIHNVLHEINGHMATMAGIQYQAAAAQYGGGVDSVIYHKYWAALVDVEAVMVPQDAAIALALRLAVQDAYGAGLETFSGMHDDLAALVASQDGALQAALDQVDPLREERNTLLLQLAQLDADNADLTQRLSNLAGVQVESERLRQEIADLREQVIPDYQASMATRSAEIERLTQRLGHRETDLTATRERMVEALAEVDRLTEQNVIAVGTLNSLTEMHSNGNGNGVDPTAPTSATWGRACPAWTEEGAPHAT